MRLQKIIPAAVLAVSIVPAAAMAQSGATPHTLVYKTKKDYSKYVAVELSADKKTVTYYPAPTDMEAIGKLRPVQLHKGYWMSKSGVSVNTAYLNKTTAAYSKLKKVPTDAEMLKMVKYKSVVTEVCDCGKRGAMTEQQINELIDKNELHTKCKKIK